MRSRHATTVLAAHALCALVLAPPPALGFQVVCPSCDAAYKLAECPNTISQCTHGVVKDICDCCDVCGKGLGESCSYSSKCVLGLRCEPTVYKRGSDLYYDPSGRGTCVAAAPTTEAAAATS